MRARSVVREVLGNNVDAADVLERLAEALRMLDETAADDTADETTRADMPSPARNRRKA